MKTLKIGDKIKLTKSHYLFNDWAVGRSGEIKSIDTTTGTCLVSVNGKVLCVEAQDLRLEECNTAESAV